MRKVPSEAVRQVVQKEMRAKYDLFHEKGTVFTKYGRYGDPKQRVVWLSDDET